jgi:hypothetical protein
VLSTCRLLRNAPGRSLLRHLDVRFVRRLTMSNTATLPPVTLPDLMNALSATEANIRWWEGDGTLPKAERDPDGNLLWNVQDLQAWSKSENGKKFIARRV